MLDTPTTSTYTVRAYMNCDNDFLSGYRPEHRVATEEDLILTVAARTAAEAAEVAYSVGNRIMPDRLGHRWPRDVRSISVGDVLSVRDVHDYVTYFACEPVGFRELGTDTHDTLTLHTTQLAGQGRVTSR